MQVAEAIHAAVANRLSPLELDAWQALLHAHHQITRRLDAELRKEQGVSFGEYDVLLRLARAPERRLTMTELARRVMISPSGLTRVVDGLSDEGLVRRERNPDDARVVYAQLTTKAARAFARRRRPICGAFASILQSASVRPSFGRWRQRSR